MAKDPARPEGDERAEHSRCLVRDGAKPIAWVDSDNGDIAIHSTADPFEIRVALIAAMVRLRDLESIADAAGLPVELRRQGAIGGDPYACDGWTFADESGSGRPEFPGHEHPVHVVRRRIFDDVYAAHRMLDAIGVASGPLTARIGLMVLPSAGSTSAPVSLEDHLKSAHAIASRDIPRRSHGSGEPLADVADVKIPKPDDVLAVLDQLTGEEAFKVFDHVNVLPGRTAEDRRWVLTDADDVRQMIADCCAVALNLGKLAEVYKAAREALARKEAR